MCVCNKTTPGIQLHVLKAAHSIGPTVSARAAASVAAIYQHEFTWSTHHSCSPNKTTTSFPSCFWQTTLGTFLRAWEIFESNLTSHTHIHILPTLMSWQGNPFKRCQSCLLINRLHWLMANDIDGWLQKAPSFSLLTHSIDWQTAEWQSFSSTVKLSVG